MGSNPDALEAAVLAAVCNDSKIDILGLIIDKNQDAPDEGIQAIQYAFFVHQNRFVELDYRTEEQGRPDFRTFAHVRELYERLTAEGRAGPTQSDQEVSES